MLKEVKLNNYRGFEKHIIPLRRFTIAVGENNAGKSTLVEALRLVTLVSSRFENLGYRRPPDWLDLARGEMGVVPSLRGTEINFDTLCFNYNDPPAKIEASFENGSSISIYLGGENNIYAVIKNSKGKTIRSKTSAKNLKLPDVAIMPQIGPLEADETVLSEEYIRRALSTHLASRHFRNQIRVFPHHFEHFQNSAEENWRGLRVLSMEVERNYPGDPIFLQIRNQDFVGEVGIMGHGLQMWLQTIWFLTRSRDAHTIILDEPDVYMHPDLQRRLVRYLMKRFNQVILTSHSVEIMSEVQPNAILIIDRRKSKSRFADSLPAVQRVLGNVGSTQNIHLARLWATRRVILVEGSDMMILKRVHDILFPESESLESVPNMPIGGWSGWPYAIGSSMAFRNAMGQEIKCYCILDSDYHTPRQISGRYDEAKSKDVELHIWSNKEIENYLLIPDVIFRIIDKNSRNKRAPTVSDIENKIGELAEVRRDEVLDGYADEFYFEDRSKGHRGANVKARELLREVDSKAGNIFQLASGKAIMSDLSKWTQDEYQVSFGVRTILNEIKPEEIQKELKSLVSAIENGQELGSNQ